MNLKQAQKFLKDHNIRYVLAQFVDIHGVAKTKSVPVSHFEDILTAGDRKSTRLNSSHG